jgi:hypothetical protein
MKKNSPGDAAMTPGNCRRRVRTSIILGALAALLGGCAVPVGQAFPPGTSIAAVTQRMGPPAGDFALPSGGRRLAYGGGAYSRQTLMFDFDASGQLVRAEQVLDEAHFNTIRAGMTADEVLARIGGPATTWPIPRQHQIVWSYRYDSPFCKWFMVGMGTQGQVVDTAYGPDPLCDADEFFAPPGRGGR